MQSAYWSMRWHVRAYFESWINIVIIFNDWLLFHVCFAIFGKHTHTHTHMPRDHGSNSHFMDIFKSTIIMLWNSIHFSALIFIAKCHNISWSIFVLTLSTYFVCPPYSPPQCNEKFMCVPSEKELLTWCHAEWYGICSMSKNNVFIMWQPSFCFVD